MTKKIGTAVALAACAGTQVFAQTELKTKEDTITFSLTAQGQNSVSTTSGRNVGNWSQSPNYYKTRTEKFTQVQIIKAIGKVLHPAAVAADYYDSKAKLVLAQGELTGFFNITPDLTESTANRSEGFLDGTFYTSNPDDSSFLANSGNSTYLQRPNGRHLKRALEEPHFYPTGHHQPWGQIYLRDVTRGTCENVTFFFTLTVQECYDCYYMNSFISDTTFTTKSTTTGGDSSGPPCCTIPSTTSRLDGGKGKDRYHLTLTFDNSDANPYLDPNSTEYYVGGVENRYAGIWGLHDSDVDGITPDALQPASDQINKFQTPLEPLKMRFTLNGLFTYDWNLKKVNSADLLPDFVGTGKYEAYGYGFIGLVCTLLNGTVNFSEKVVNAAGCCLDLPWYNNSWYGVGYDGGTGYFDESPYNPQPALTTHSPIGYPILSED